MLEYLWKILYCSCTNFHRATSIFLSIYFCLFLGLSFWNPQGLVEVWCESSKEALISKRKAAQRFWFTVPSFLEHLSAVWRVQLASLSCFCYFRISWMIKKSRKTETLPELKFLVAFLVSSIFFKWSNRMSNTCPDDFSRNVLWIWLHDLIRFYYF